MHSTSTFKLNAVSSELVESRSTCAAERDDVASVAHFSNRYDYLCSPVFLGALRKSPTTLTPSRVRKQIVALPVVVN